MNKVAIRLLFGLVTLQFLTTIALLVIGYKLKDEIVPTLRTKLKSEILVGDIRFSLLSHWPELSIQLQELSLKDSARLDEAALVSAKEVALSLNPLECLMSWHVSVSKIKLSGIKVNLKRDSLDKGNWSFVQALTTENSNEKHGEKTSGINFMIKRVYFDKVVFRFQDVNEGKDIGINLQSANLLVSKSDSLIHGHLKGSVYMNGLKFNNIHEAFLHERKTQLNARFSLPRSFNTIYLDQVTLTESNVDYKLKGFVTTNKPTLLNLLIETENTHEKLILPLLPADIAQKIARFQHDGAISATAQVSGQASQGAEPRVMVKFRPIDGKVIIPDMPFTLEHVSCEGVYTNQHDTLLPAGNKNSSVTIARAEGEVFEIPFKSKVLVTDFTDPFLSIDAEIEADLAKPYKFQPYKNLVPKSGKLIFKANYKTRSKPWIDYEKLKHLPGKITGKLIFNNASLRFKSPAWTVKNLNGQIAFSEDNLQLQKLSLNLNNNQLSLKGQISGWISKMFEPNATVKGNLDVSSPRANLYSFLNDLEHNPNALANPTKKQNQPDKDELPLKNTDLVLNVKLDKLVAQNFTANQVLGKVHIKNQEISAKLDLKSAGGTTHVDGHISGFATGKYFIKTNLNLHQLNVAETFRMFNNFNQKTLRHEHLNGKLNFSGHLSSPIKPTMIPEISGLKGDFSATLTSGELKNFEPIANLGNVVFRKRNFKHVTFEELKTNFRLEGTRLYVPLMEISSSVFEMYLGGEYDFDTLQNYEMNVRVPLKNLKNPAKSKKEHVRLGDSDKTSVPLKIARTNGKTETKIDWKQAKAELKNLF